MASGTDAYPSRGLRSRSSRSFELEAQGYRLAPDIGYPITVVGSLENRV